MRSEPSSPSGRLRSGGRGSRHLRQNENLRPPWPLELGSVFCSPLIKVGLHGTGSRQPEVAETPRVELDEEYLRKSLKTWFHQDLGTQSRSGRCGRGAIA